MTDDVGRPAPSEWRTLGKRGDPKMGAIRVHEFTTLDGIISAPSWSFDFGFDPKMGEAIGGLMGGCRAILLGRTTFEMFEPAWSVRSAEDDPGAPFMNDTQKYVVSSTLSAPTWRNSTPLGAYDPQRIRRLKDDVDGGIYVSGSATLVRALLSDGLVDELHLFVYPLTLGTGPRLFPESELWFSLAAIDRYDNGVVRLVYGLPTV
jgi:dihydrofolate reductase